MKPTVGDMRGVETAIQVFQKIVDRGAGISTDQSDRLYFQLLQKVMIDFRTAASEGTPIVGCSSQTPTEIFRAMGMFPYHDDGVIQTMNQLSGIDIEALERAVAFGMPMESCSCLRLYLGNVVSSWLPRTDLLVWTPSVCDGYNVVKGAAADVASIPQFYLDRPYHYTEASVRYFAGQLRELIALCETLFKRRMDWDRLEEAVALSFRGIEQMGEINQLRKAKPHPLKSRKAINLAVVGWQMSGTSEQVAYYDGVLEEIKERVRQGVGFVPKENYRLLSFLITHSRMFKLFDWMEQQYGATSVADLSSTSWGEDRYPSNDPVMKLASKAFFQPASASGYGPHEETLLPLTRKLAKEYEVDGAMFWAVALCPMSTGILKAVKDTLSGELGIPTVQVDSDLVDPAYNSEDTAKVKLEGFFDILASRKKQGRN